MAESASGRPDAEPAATDPGSVPEVIAHRGYAARYPENTLPALEAAVAAGARFVEVDVQLDGDGTPVLFHDRDLRRVCGVRGAMHACGGADLERLRAFEPGRFGDRFADTPVMTLSQLREFLETHAGVAAFVEVKAISVRRFGERRVLEAIASELRPVARRCVLISFSLPLIEAARDLASRGVAGWHAVGTVFGRWPRIAALRHLAPEYVFCDVAGLPRRGRIRFGSAMVAAYEVGSVAEAMQLHRRGVDLVETFDVGPMLAGLAALAASVRAGSGFPD